MVRKQKANPWLAIMIVVLLIIAITLLVHFLTSQGICKGIKGVEKDTCVYDEAILSNTVKLCNQIANLQLKDSCIAELATGPQGAKLCRTLNPQAHGRCFKEIAEKTLNSSLCSEIAVTNWADVCFGSLANLTNNSKLCRNLESLTSQDTCFYSFALEKIENRACLSINNASRQGMCNLELAVLADDPELCNKTVKKSYQGICYMHFAVNRSDSSYCASISAGAIRDNCYLKFIS